jgi:hypothetical protein
MDLSVGEEMQDDRMDCFVMQDGPNKMVNLLLEEQINIIYGELSNSKDFEDWIQFVLEEEERRNEIFLGKQAIKLPHIFQLGLEKQKKKNQWFLQVLLQKRTIDGMKIDEILWKLSTFEPTNQKGCVFNAFS